MAAQSPRPIVHRAFSVMIALLLVTSMAAPIAATGTASATTASSAAAQESTDSDGGYIDGSFEGTCDTKLRFAFPVSCPHADFDEPDINESAARDSIAIDIHTGSQGIYEGSKQVDSIYQNYLQDTSTLASLEARNAIADAYENNKSVENAQGAGQGAIQQYYAQHQRQTLEMVSADAQEFAYYGDIIQGNSEIAEDYVHMWGARSDTGSIENHHLTGDTETVEFELVNGSTHSYRVPLFDFSYSESLDNGGGSSGETEGASFDHYNSTSGQFEYTSSIGGSYRWTGVYGILNEPAASLETQAVYDMGMIADRLEEIEKQAETVQSNYDDSAAEDLYAAMDSGQISPNDVRGAEGMVRYMSGDSEATEDRFNLALRSTLDLAAADLDSTMVVQFTGATDRTENVSEDGSKSYEYNRVNETYEGMLFSSETPDGGFEKNTTYNVENFNGTTTMLYDGGSSEATFYRGNFTIEEIYDSDGNSVDNVNWEDPKYDSYDAEEFIAALQNASEERSKIVIENGGGDGDVGGGGDCIIMCGDGNGGNETLGLIAVGAIMALLVAGKVR